MIASVFSDRNVVVCASPYNLKDVLEIVDNIDFKNPDDSTPFLMSMKDFCRDWATKIKWRASPTPHDR